MQHILPYMLHLVFERAKHIHRWKPLVISGVSGEGSKYWDCLGIPDGVPAVLLKERLQGSARLHSVHHMNQGEAR